MMLAVAAQTTTAWAFADDEARTAILELREQLKASQRAQVDLMSQVEALRSENQRMIGQMQELTRQVETMDKRLVEVEPAQVELNGRLITVKPAERREFEKAVELGVTKIIPVLTSRTNADKVKTERFAAQAVEAAEQCGRLSVPEIAEPIELNNLLRSWENDRQLFFMDERRSGADALTAFSHFAGKPAALLVGPEGGFSDDETAVLNRHPCVKDISLGPRILRAETAATAALAVWQAVAGDWRHDGEKQ